MGKPLQPFPDGWSTAVVVAAHPDDIEWGAGAAVAAWTAAGRTVHYVLASTGEAGVRDVHPREAARVRREEERQAAEELGVASVTFLHHPDGAICESLRLRRDITRELRRQRPELVAVFNPYDRWGTSPGAPWNSADHRAVGRCALDAADDAGNQWIHRDLQNEGLPAWDGIRHVGIFYSPTPTHAVDVTGHESAAERSLAAHTVYLAAVAPGDEGFAHRVIGNQVARHADRFDGRSCVALEILGGEP